MATHPRRACARAYLLHLFLALLPCCGFLRHAAAQSQPADEARLLLQIKRAWGDPPVLAAWNASSAAGAHCNWPYVMCDTATGLVASLSLGSTNVAGPFPDAVGNLTGLTYLDVSNNNINDTFPASLYRCGSLQFLNLSQNYFGGELPADIGGRLSANLTTLDINGNEFNGTIPTSLSRLRSLQFLALNNNRFAGTFPAELGDLASLQVLKLSQNRFDADNKLPASFSKLTKLRNLLASESNLVGDFPSFLQEMPELQFLYISNNSLTGSIPAGVWSLKKLQIFYAFANNLSGSLAVDGFAAASLTGISLGDNNLSGTIPEVFGTLKNLTELYLYSNNFSGQIPANISQLPSLWVLRLDNNRLSGTLPPELGKHSPRLTFIEADGNELTGAIPEGLCEGGQLKSFTASGNRLNGSIPAALASCPTLQWVRLENNRLSGEVPQALWTSTRLGTVLLGNNQLTGSLPPTMSSSLTLIRINNNQFVGSVPAAAAALKEFTADNNQFSGQKRRRLEKRDDWKITPFQVLDFGEAAILRGLTEENLVGRGGSGRVYRVTYTNRRTGSAGVVAVKKIRGAGALDEKLEREFESEASILGNVRHINIVRLLCCVSGPESKLLVYEYMDNGSLDKWLHGSIPDATDKSIRYAGYSDEIEVVFRLGVMCTSSSPSSRPTMKDVLQILLKCSEQTEQKSKTGHSTTPEYEAAPFLVPQRGSRRKQLSNGTGIDMDEKSDFDSIV
ncbi:hypothetical protein EJB05_17034, partial [Eragrostis curvula]